MSSYSYSQSVAGCSSLVDVSRRLSSGTSHDQVSLTMSELDSYSDSSSLLTYMKPIMDRAIHPYIKTKDFTKDAGNVIFLADFVEGVTVESAIDVSRKRAGF